MDGNCGSVKRGGDNDMIKKQIRAIEYAERMERLGFSIPEIREWMEIKGYTEEEQEEAIAAII